MSIVAEVRVEGATPPAAGTSSRVTVEGTPVAIFNVGGHLFAVDARCTHVGGPLDRGKLTGTIVTCPLHGSQFDLESGAVVRGPAMRPVVAYRVREAGGALVFSKA